MPDSYDIEFFWDPVCPFAWITSRWVVKVAAQTDYAVDWRFISLRILNKDKDYATHFPEGYLEGHTAGLRQLRVAAAVRAELGRDSMGPLFTAFGEAYWDRTPDAVDRDGMRFLIGSGDHIASCVEAAGLDVRFAEAADDESFDAVIEEETELALSRTGRDVGTPIITFEPPDGLSFFGPVISRVPSDEEAVELWDAVIRLAQFPGFAEMKRSLRERPQLQILGEPTEVPVEEDWHGGRRV